MESSECGRDLPLKESGRRTTNACLRCQQRKKRCDGNIPQCTSCADRHLTCTYLGVRRRGRGKTKTYLERLEARVTELEASSGRHLAGVSLRSGNGNLASNETASAQPTLGTCKSGTTYAVSQVTNPSAIASESGGRNEPILCGPEASFSVRSRIPGDHEKQQSLLKKKLFETLPEQTAAGKLRSEANHGPFTSSIFIQLPPKSQVQAMFEVAFNELNYTIPLFDVPILIDLLGQHYADPSVSPGKYPARWAMLNATIAIGIQLRTARGSHGEMMGLSWDFFKNAFSMYSAIALRGTDILSLEALLAMAVYMQGSSDVRTTSVLICAAARLSLIIGLHQEAFYCALDPPAANRHRRAFWIAYLLDKSILVKTGLSSVFDDSTISLDYPYLAVSAPLVGENVLGSNLLGSSVLRLLAELVTIGCSVEKQLYSRLSSVQNVRQPLDVVTELDQRLEQWKAKVPADLQPDHIIWSTQLTARKAIILLHFGYYLTLSEIHGFTAHLNQEGDVITLQQIQSSKVIQASAASQIIHTLKYLPFLHPGHLWNILCYPVSACIILLAMVLQDPADAQARFHARYIGDFVKFLRKVQRDQTLQVQSLLDLCSAFERLALYTISKASNGTGSLSPSSDNNACSFHRHGQEILSYANGRISSLQLAQGLMGNIPNLCSSATKIFSDLFPGLHLSSSASVLVPSLLIPETYGFNFT